MSFMDVTWAQDRSVVAVFVWFGGSPVEIAFDRILGRRRPFDEIRPIVAQHKRSEYDIPSDVHSDREVFEWACTLNTSRIEIHHSHNLSPNTCPTRSVISDGDRNS